MAHHDHHTHHTHHMASSTGGGTMHEEVYRCSMNMLFTWSTENLCLVFRWWHVSSTFSLIMSLLGVVALSAGYEFLREFTRRVEARLEARPNSTPQPTNQETTRLLPGSANVVSTRKAHTIKAALYGLQVFYSFFIMLLFMTYNGWVMIAVAIGASVGYCLWGGASATKSVACH